MTKITPLISIISPVYNAEPYIKKCLNSILTQTFQDWELILIDDGSSDRSGIICDEYAAKDSRIVVIHKENGGVSAARQTGLDIAKGEFIIHIDPDDWVESTMLQELYEKAISEDADVVICDYYVDTNDKSFVVKQEPSSLDAKTILKELFQQLHGSCCNKLAKRVYYNKFEIHFPIGLNYCEDLLTWIQMFQHDELRIAYLPRAFYHYVQHTNSITHAYTRATFKARQQFQHLLEIHLPSEEYSYEKRKSQLSVVTEAFINGVLSHREAQRLVWKNKRAALLETHSIRWLIGYLSILLYCFPVAKRCLKY